MRRDPIPEASIGGIQGHAFDIQALVATGFMPLPFCTYHLLRVDDPAAARRWLRRLLDEGLVKSVADIGSRPDPTTAAEVRKPLHDEAVAVAFTFAGLSALGFRQHDDFPFPTPFCDGMTHAARAASLGDRDVAAWDWTDAGEGAAVVHVLVAHFRMDDAVKPESPLAELATSGLSPIGAVRNCPSYTERRHEAGGASWQSFEPFGFRDGIAQPVVEGLRGFRGRLNPSDPGATERDGATVQPGEFVLGYTTEYGERAYCPDLEGWPARTLPDGMPSAFGVNGSYLVVRQIAQDVEAFRRFEAAQESVGDAPTVAERMIGRRKDGRPLMDCPAVPATIDDFDYRAVDSDGFQCPRGAHVRRANPRDSLAWGRKSGTAASKLHRLLRRGRPYADACAAAGDCPHSASRPCGHPAHRAHCGRGLFFLALNAHLERQFEMVQKRWIMAPTFGDLSGESDPLFGAALPDPATGEGNRFSIPAVPVGRTVQGFASFTRTHGGGYFFLPGLAALKFLTEA